MSFEQVGSYLVSHLPLASIIFPVALLARFVEISRQEPHLKAVFKSVHFWLYSSSHAALATGASFLLFDTTDWPLIVVWLVSVIGGLSVLRASLLKFGDTEVNLAGFFEEWRDEVVSDVQENRADAMVRRQGEVARQLEQEYEGDVDALEDEVRRLATDLDLDPDEVVERIEDGGGPSRRYDLASWVAATDLERAQSLYS